MSHWIPLLIMAGVIAVFGLWSLMWVVAVMSEHPVECECEECEAYREHAARAEAR
jgi:hypothetical protein